MSVIDPGPREKYLRGARTRETATQDAERLAEALARRAKRRQTRTRGAATGSSGRRRDGAVIEPSQGDSLSARDGS